MAADRAEHVARVMEPALAAGAWVVTDRFSGVDHRLPGLRAGTRRRRADRAGRRGPPTGWRPTCPSWSTSASRSPRPGWPRRETEAARTGWSGWARTSRAGCARASWPRRPRTPGDWIVVDGETQVEPLTAHIVASVRERLGDAPGSGSVREDRPAPALFSGVVARRTAVAALRAAAANPVHAYLFRGPAGNGGLAAAHGFAAALLCPDGGCGECATCRAALAGTDPDLHIVRRSGASVSIGDAPPGRHAGPAAAAARGAPGHRRPRRASRRPPRTGPAQDARGAAGRHRLRPAGGRGHPRAGDGGQPVRRDRRSRRCRGPSWCTGSTGSGVPTGHGGRGGGQQRGQSRTGPRHGRRSRRGGPRRRCGRRCRTS